MVIALALSFPLALSLPLPLAARSQGPQDKARKRKASCPAQISEQTSLLPFPRKRATHTCYFQPQLHPPPQSACASGSGVNTSCSTSFQDSGWPPSRQTFLLMVQVEMKDRLLRTRLSALNSGDVRRPFISSYNITH